jgi:hypothetical protein
LTTGKVEFIPYDVDNTFGMDWVNRDWGTRDVLDWVKHDNNDPRPLTSKVLANPKFFNQYVEELKNLLDNDFTEVYFFPLFDEFKSRLSESVSNDSYYSQTFGFTFSDFEMSYIDKVVDHAPYGLKPYVTIRVEKAKSQIATITSSTEMKYFDVKAYPNPSSGYSINFNYDNDKQNKRSIQVFDIYGKKQTFSHQMKSENDIQLSFNDKLPTGIYFLVNGKRNLKFLVK